MPLRTAALLLFHCEVSGAPVVADDGELVGVLSERDLLVKEADPPRGLAHREEDPLREAATVGEACSRPARTTVPDARLAAAAREMLDQDVSRLVVVGDGRVAGILTRHDVLAALVRADADILAAAREAIAPFTVQQLHLAVEWGRVAVAGTTGLHSEARDAVERLVAIDGVMTVDDHGLAWEADDLIPSPVPFT